MVEKLPGVAPLVQRSDPNSYDDNPFMDEIALVHMPQKFSFPNMRMYDDTSDPDSHVTLYKK